MHDALDAGLNEADKYYVNITLPMSVGEDTTSVEYFLGEVWRHSLTPETLKVFSKAFWQWVMDGKNVKQIQVKETTMNVRGKFRVNSVGPYNPGDLPGCLVFLSAISDADTPENERFSAATPSGEIRMYISNPEAVKVFQNTATVYVDFLPAPE